MLESDERWECLGGNFMEGLLNSGTVLVVYRDLFNPYQSLILQVRYFVSKENAY